MLVDWWKNRKSWFFHSVSAFTKNENFMFLLMSDSFRNLFGN
jgi:hypothetical protein